MCIVLNIFEFFNILRHTFSYTGIMQFFFCIIFYNCAHINFNEDKLNRIGPLDNKPSPTSSTTLSIFYLFIFWTCATRHVTCDTWLVTCDTWHMTWWGRWTFSQNFSFLALTIWEWRCAEDISTKDEWLTDWLKEWVTEVFVEQPGLYRVC